MSRQGIVPCASCFRLKETKNSTSYNNSVKTTPRKYAASLTSNSWPRQRNLSRRPGRAENALDEPHRRWYLLSSRTTGNAAFSSPPLDQNEGALSLTTQRGSYGLLWGRREMRTPAARCRVPTPCSLQWVDWSDFDVYIKDNLYDYRQVLSVEHRLYDTRLWRSYGGESLNWKHWCCNGIPRLLAVYDDAREKGYRWIEIGISNVCRTFPNASSK